MNFNELKDLARKLGGILVLNGNEPEFVILSYDQYKKTDGAAGDKEKEEDLEGQQQQEEEKTIDKLNREILALKEEIRQKESAELVANTEETEEEEPAAEAIDPERGREGPQRASASYGVDFE